MKSLSWKYINALSSRLNYNTIPYGINRVKSRDHQDPIKRRVRCLINNGPLLLLVYEKSTRNVCTYLIQLILQYNTIAYEIYQLKSRDPIFFKSRHILDPIHIFYLKKWLTSWLYYIKWYWNIGSAEKIYFTKFIRITKNTQKTCPAWLFQLCINHSIGRTQTSQLQTNSAINRINKNTQKTCPAWLFQLCINHSIGRTQTSQLQNNSAINRSYRQLTYMQRYTKQISTHRTPHPAHTLHPGHTLHPAHTHAMARTFWRWSMTAALLRRLQQNQTKQPQSLFYMLVYDTWYVVVTSR